ncbi:hypothetical protein F5888DRAFT_1904723 [Russula emetica]|nr:hypothetical protein F5888DRAFT_1904723 [Russula emetica]
MHGTLRRIVERAVDIARKGGGDSGTSVDIHMLGSSDSNSNVVACELHVSLTRPFFLRTYQREEMKCAVRDAANAHPPFVASFAAFSDLTNDEQTQDFLCMEIGAGHQELRALSDVLALTLRSFRQKEDYERPHFNASFTWVLLDRPTQRSPPAQTAEDSEPLPIAAPLEDPASENTNSFPTIPHLPENIIPALNALQTVQLPPSHSPDKHRTALPITLRSMSKIVSLSDLRQLVHRMEASPPPSPASLSLQTNKNVPGNGGDVAAGPGT